MEILVEFDKKKEFPEAAVPEIMSSNTIEWGSDGFEGDTIYRLYLISKELLATAADFITVGGFIYMLIKEYGAKVNINKKLINSKTILDFILCSFSILQVCCFRA